MKTLVCIQPGEFAYREADAPLARPGHCIIKIKRIGICGTDLHAFEGTQPFFTYPRVLGHELAVEVIEAGEGVAGFRPGDRCAVNPYMTCGVCAACSRGRSLNALIEVANYRLYYAVMCWRMAGACG